MIDLPKWPQILVHGNPVSKELAAEIILRTSMLRFTCNDRKWEQQLYSELNVPVDEHTFPDSEELSKCMKELGILDLDYLYNSRIASAFVLGPHGWIDWDGNVSCYRYNIGKWPTVEVVEKDWSVIAEAWPQLNLRCQLLDGEACEENAKEILVEFAIYDGKCKRLTNPGVLLKPPLEGTTYSDFVSRWRAHENERGCTIEQFKWAVNLVKKHN